MILCPSELNDLARTKIQKIKPAQKTATIKLYSANSNKNILERNKKTKRNYSQKTPLSRTESQVHVKHPNLYIVLLIQFQHNKLYFFPQYLSGDACMIQFKASSNVVNAFE